MSGGSAGRRRAGTRYTQESEALNQIAAQAEARLSAKRAARAEAREIRMKELEKQQREAEERQDKSYELLGDRATTHRASSRRGSDDSGDPSDNPRDVKNQLMELEDKYKKAMMNNAQLDNEKQSLIYQVDLLKDRMEEMEESMLEVQRECKDRSRELEAKKRDYKQLGFDLEFVKHQLELRDKLIEEHGLIFVGLDDSTIPEEPEPTVNGAVNGEVGEQQETQSKPAPKAKSTALLTLETAQLIQDLGEGTLDEKIAMFSTERKSLLDQIKSLKCELEEEREKNELAEKYASPRNTPNGPDMEVLEVQRRRAESSLASLQEQIRQKENQLRSLSTPSEANKQVSEYKFKLQKAEQDITTLEGNVIRLEGQVKRYKTAADNAEKVEEELKQEKRKLTRELRESQSQLEELTTQNNHLQKRLDKIKSARNQLVRS